ncbi:CDP-alcohol phosphatidyltransferase family protein [Filobacillus milosensis]|uniref:CDP-alcohol phosphatidyltransferase family protein n=1 Tax=Filobacillus milosensis TaxID=94137 RepID=A0A4Y8IFI0_9BACI|nr:CDP-alcohol phosphatidyltransferase family protein [Filobacillus milosensis]TFB18913.1 CDP-alcohol phosphatidyltransferase family protein [Filobacillus milosensis]
MKISEVKKSLKKDPPYSYYSALQRRMGLIVTWVLLNAFPSVSANTITVLMLPLSLMASGVLYYAILNANLTLLILVFFLSVFIYVLDGVDGNIARFKRTTSIQGVYLDRLVHNITGPIFFLVVGFATYEISDDIFYLPLFIGIAIFSELSPLDVSQKDVEALFIRQAVHKQTLNYEFSIHKKSDKACGAKLINHKGRLNKFIKSILTIDGFYISLIIDVWVFQNQFYFTALLGVIYILGKIYVRSNTTKWEKELIEVLEKLNVKES